jgi:hypothetical protein
VASWGVNDYAQLWLGVGVGMGVYAERRFVANFLYFLGIVWRFMPVALDGVVGM